MRSLRLWSIILIGLMASGLLVSATAFAMAGQDEPPPDSVIVSDLVVPKLSPIMRDVTYAPPIRALDREEINPIKNPGLFLPDFGLSGTDTKAQDPLVAGGLGPMAAPNPDINFEGQGDFDMYAPPDTTGDVGPDHFVQMVNVETAVYDKSGNLIDHWANNQLWAGFGGPCESDNSGDPIVLYDDLNDRWLLSQFAIETSQHMCLAVSTTSDPTGSYNLYAFYMPDFPDYPKFGVWPDGYYLGTNSGAPNQYYAHVFERKAMLVGDPATMISVGGQANFLMPADVDGTLPPADDAPGTFYTFFDGGYPDHPAGVDRLALFEFNADWDTPINSTFTLVQEIPISEFNYTTCGFFELNCLPQLDTITRLDAVDPWPMVRLQYRNFGPYEGMVGNFTVDVDGSDHAGIRWFELRRQGASAWNLQQEGTYAPDEHNRFMGSIAMDGSGNIALGYSITSASMYPSIRYTVHARGDGPGTMRAEAELMAGSGSQTSTQRWGDYSATVVDPNDNCTFWITNMYHDQMDTDFSWNTRIGAFRVPSCTGSLGYTGAMAGVVIDSSNSDPIANVNVEATFSITQTFSSRTDETGSYIFNDLPLGTYTVTASAFGYLPITINGAEVFSGTTTTIDFTLDPVPSHLVSGTVTDANTGLPLGASINIDGYPGNLIWTDPETGYYEISLPEGSTYIFNVNGDSGYLPVSLNVGPLTANITQNIVLDVDTDTCSAPGYYPEAVLFEQFESTTIPTGWTVINNIDYDAAVWTFDNPGKTNYTGGSGNFAIVDSDYAGEVNVDTELHTPVMDFTGQAAIILRFKHDFHQNSDEKAAVDVSNDGGLSWNNVWLHSGSSLQGTVDIDISALAANEPDVVIRFHYYDAFYEWWWQIDDVLIGPPSCIILNGIELAPTTDNLAGTPGETVIYKVKVTNIGNIPNTFFISISGSDNNWITDISKASVTLGPDESTDFTVTVAIPTNAVIGESNTVTITAFAVTAANPTNAVIGESNTVTITGGGPSAKSTIMLATTVVLSDHQIFLPLITRQTR